MAGVTLPMGNLEAKGKKGILLLSRSCLNEKRRTVGNCVERAFSRQGIVVLIHILIERGNEDDAKNCNP